MRLFDKDRICRTGMSLRDLVVFAAIYILVVAILLALVNAMFPAWQTKYRIASWHTLFMLGADFIAIIILGLFAGWIVRGRLRIVAQCVAIFMLHGIISFEIVRLVSLI